MKEIIKSQGHANVLGTHSTTIEITKSKELSLKGDCIIGVNAEKACADLSPEFKEKLKTDCEVKIILKTGELEETITGRGHPDLTLTNLEDIVIRKSDFIDDRTLYINCDKACKDLNREFIEKLKNPEQELILEIFIQ